METIIAGLLKDFEDGKMTRRQLIQSLALAAAAAMPGAAATAQRAGQAAPQSKPPIPQAFEPAPWKTVCSITSRTPCRTTAAAPRSIAI